MYNYVLGLDKYEEDKELSGKDSFKIIIFKNEKDFEESILQIKRFLLQ
jgi:hypothetical protein